MKHFSNFWFAIILALSIASCGDEKVDENKGPANPIQSPQPSRLNEVISYTENPYSKDGYENIKTYYYGLYITTPKDTVGIADEVMDFLKNKSKDVMENEAIQVWIFSDSSVIPNSFKGEWSTEMSRKKCFANAAKLTNGNLMYNYDMFGEFEP